MKRFGLIVSMLFVFGWQLMAQGTSFKVQGYVYDIATAAPASGYDVYIYADSNSANWYYKDIATTDKSGFYSFIITIPTGTTVPFYLFVYDCNGYLDTSFTNSTSLVTKDFYICTQTYPSCMAMFKWDFDSPNSNLVNFYDASYGNIVKWEWDFGDSTTSNLQNPSHTFYTFPAMVCLKVSDSAGTCRDSLCMIIGDTVIYPGCYSWFYYTTSGDTVSFYAYGMDSMKKVIYNWDFGDSTTSHVANPVHVYKSQIGYAVCLEVIEIDSKGDSCISNYCDKVFFNSQSSNGIAGMVYSATGLAIDKAMVYLIWYNPKDSTLTAIDSTSTIDSGGVGYFYFDNINSGDFLVKASLTPKSANYSSFMPTYLDTSLFWYKATTFTFYPNTGTYMYVMLDMIKGKNPGGPGFIGGKVSQGANILISGNEGDFMPNVEVMVTDMDDVPYIYDYSDKNGSFDLSKLPYGTYKVYAEIPGFITSPAIVTLSAAKPSVNIDFVVTEKVVTASLRNSNEIEEAAVGIYPNPVRDQLNIQVKSMVSEQVSIEILNATGKLVNRMFIKVESGSTTFNINTSELGNPGLYLVRLISGSGVKTASFIYLK